MLRSRQRETGKPSQSPVLLFGIAPLVRLGVGTSWQWHVQKPQIPLLSWQVLLLLGNCFLILCGGADELAWEDLNLKPREWHEGPSTPGYTLWAWGC
jgi:hypothetical protein